MVCQLCDWEFAENPRHSLWTVPSLLQTTQDFLLATSIYREVRNLDYWKLGKFLLSRVRTMAIWFDTMFRVPSLPFPANVRRSDDDGQGLQRPSHHRVAGSRVSLGNPGPLRRGWGNTMVLYHFDARYTIQIVEQILVETTFWKFHMPCSQTTVPLSKERPVSIFWHHGAEWEVFDPW